MAEKFSGVFTAMITPFTSSGELDENGLAEVLDYLISRKVDGIYAAGTTGEGVSMSLGQRKRLAEICADRCDGKVPLIVHVGANAIEDVKELSLHAKETGVDAIAAVPGSYYKPDQEAIMKYFSIISSFTDLPMFIYHIPPMTGVHLSPETAIEIMEEHSNVTGIKDSSGDFRNLQQLIYGKPRGRTVFCGTDDYFLPGLITGMDGCVSGYSNAFPESYVHLYKLFRNGEISKAMAIQSRISELRALLTEPRIQPIKEAMKLKGVNAGFVRPPLRHMTEKEIVRLKRELRSQGAI
jgi:4-hydroxy-tetrahydrodipicolinate synthase